MYPHRSTHHCTPACSPKQAKHWDIIQEDNLKTKGECTIAGVCFQWCMVQYSWVAACHCCFMLLLLCCCKAFQNRFIHLSRFTVDAICSVIFLCYKSVVHNHFWTNAPHCHQALLLPTLKNLPHTQRFWPLSLIEKCQVSIFFLIKTTGDTQVLVDVSMMSSSTFHQYCCAAASWCQSSAYP